MRRKKVTIKRIDASVLRPKKLKPFDEAEFIRLSEALQRAVRKEEKKYGSLNDNIEQI